MNINYEIINKKEWKQEIDNHKMMYPSEFVIRFLARYFANHSGNNNLKIIDLGFGSGRNIRAILDYNIQAYGIDYLEDCLNITQELYGHHKNLKKLILGNFGLYDYINNGIKEMDGAICIGSIFLHPKKDMLNYLKHISTIIKSDGKLLINFRNKENYFYGMGEDITGEGNTFKLENSEYKGYVYTFLDKDETEQLLDNAGFEIDYFEREDFYKHNLKNHNSWWVVTAHKK